MSLTTPEAVAKRWQLLDIAPESKASLFDEAAVRAHEAYTGNIENLIGTVKVPVGLVGPLRVNGLCAQGDFYVPLATTEAALVASYDRGARVLSESGGACARVLSEGVSRSPGFAFKSLHDAGAFVSWANSSVEALRLAAAATTRHGRLADMRATIEGNHVYLNFEFLTGEAAGQNMVTIATSAICDYIEVHSPVTPEYFFLEANFSGDKKASAAAFKNVRGKNVVAEVSISKECVARRLHTNARRIEDCWRMAAVGSVMSGAVGMQGHYANALTALYLACGQDIACVCESAVGITRMQAREDGGLYACVTLPNLLVGTIGGGTSLPSQRACLDILGLRGPGQARAFAEIAASVVLAGELSIIGAMCAHHFARAHKRLARGKDAKID